MSIEHPLGLNDIGNLLQPLCCMRISTNAKYMDDEAALGDDYDDNDDYEDDDGDARINLFIITLLSSFLCISCNLIFN